MTPGVGYANYLVALSKKKYQEMQDERDTNMYNLKSQLLEEQIKEARLRNELLQRSLDKQKGKDTTDFSI